MENAFDVESLMGMGSTGLPVQKFSWIKTDIGRDVYFSIYKKRRITAKRLAAQLHSIKTNPPINLEPFSAASSCAFLIIYFVDQLKSYNLIKKYYENTILRITDLIQTLFP